MIQDEHKEHTLALLNGKEVIAVRPYFGTQSDSWKGTLVKEKDEGWNWSYFQFQSAGFSIRFRCQDVKEIKTTAKDHIIYLKGPEQYQEKYEDYEINR